jgi:hypothetical protein
MLNRFWKFLQNGKNREILSWLGGGAVAVIAGIWAAILFLFPAQKVPDLSHFNAQANCGGVAIVGGVKDATITAGSATGADCSTKSK